VLLCADYVPEAIIEALRDIWGTEVFTHYGSTESGQGGGVECSAHDGYHPRWADLLIEIIDPYTGRGAIAPVSGRLTLAGQPFTGAGSHSYTRRYIVNPGRGGLPPSECGQPLPRGLTGEIVLTTLTRQAQPLIRYRTGDLAGLIDRPCACGSRLPRLGKVLGRFDNLIWMKRGALISMPHLDEIMFRFDGVLYYQAELSPDLSALRLVVRPYLAGPDPEELIDRIKIGIDPDLPVSLELDPNLRTPVTAKRVIRSGPSL
jgi:phenylacetate-coenzyme A ligase PaaK-like adenylate-forming protein